MDVAHLIDGTRGRQLLQQLQQQGHVMAVVVSCQHKRPFDKLMMVVRHIQLHEAAGCFYNISVCEVFCQKVLQGAAKSDLSSLQTAF